MKEQLEDRALLLVESASLAELEKSGSSSYTRWQNIKRKRARIAAAEIEILGKVFPAYRWWLMTGEEMPEAGQVSPETENVRKSLQQTGTGTN